jgi:glucose-1-phosphate adenylyltransferase
MPFPLRLHAAHQPGHPPVHAFILAGGRGSRLQDLTATRAKPAVAVAGTLRLLDFTLSNCLNSGVSQLSVLTQYRSDSIERHLRGNWCSSAAPGAQVEVLPSVRPDGYCGTANAVHQHLDRLRRQGVRQVLVLAGDHVCKMDLRRMLASHTTSGAGLTVAALQMPAHEAAGAFGVLHTDAFGQVLGFLEKPDRPPTLPGQDGQALVSMGIYAADLDLLQTLLALDADDPQSCHDFGHDVLPRAAAEGLLGVHRFDQSCVRADGKPVYWRDVGSLDSYWRTHCDLAGAAPALDLFDQAWPLHTRPRALPPAQVLPGSGGRLGGIAGCLIAGGCRVDAASVRGSVLSTGVQVGAGSMVEDSVLLPGAVVGRHARLHRVIVDENCMLPDGIEIGFDAAEDRAQFHVTAAGVTLVTAAMLAAAARPMRPHPRRVANGSSVALRG